MASVKAAHVAAAGKRYVVPLASSAQMPRMQRSQKKSDRAEGQPVGEMNSPQGEGRAVLAEQCLRLRRCSLSHRLPGV